MTARLFQDYPTTIRQTFVTCHCCGQHPHVASLLNFSPTKAAKQHKGHPSVCKYAIQSAFSSYVTFACFSPRNGQQKFAVTCPPTTSFRLAAVGVSEHSFCNVVVVRSTFVRLVCPHTLGLFRPTAGPEGNPIIPRTGHPKSN